MSEPRFLTTTKAARLLGVGRVRCWQLCADGTLPAIQVGRRYLVDSAKLDTLAVEQARERREGSR